LDLDGLGLEQIRHLGFEPQSSYIFILNMMMMMCCRTVEVAENSLTERTAEDQERKLVREVENLLDLHKRQIADGHSLAFADRHLNEAKTHIGDLELCTLFRGKAARLIEEILRLDDTRGSRMRSAPARDRRDAPVITRTTKKPENREREGALYGRKTELA
jgi:hypothetical protein